MNYPNRSKSRGKYVAMMFLYTILLSVVFVNFAAAGVTGKMILAGFGSGIIIGVFRETKFRRMAKRDVSRV